MTTRMKRKKTEMRKVRRSEFAVSAWRAVDSYDDTIQHVLHLVFGFFSLWWGYCGVQRK